MGRPPGRSDDDRSSWGSDSAPPRRRPESRPIQVARTVRDMFTRGPRRRGERNTPDSGAPPGSPVPATPAWLNSPPPPHTTVAGMERGEPTPRSAPSRGGPSGRLSRGGASGGLSRGGSSAGLSRGGLSGRLSRGSPDGGPDSRRRGGPGAEEPLPSRPADPSVAPPRWQPPDWLPSAPPMDGSHGPSGNPGFPSAGAEYGRGEYAAAYGASGEYSGYAPYTGSPAPFEQNAPQYVPPLTAKTPASPPGGPSWRQAAPSYVGRALGEGYPAQGGAPGGPAPLAHAQISSSPIRTGEYVPGGQGELEWARQPETPRASSAGPNPYYWELAARIPQAALVARLARWAVTALFIVAALFSFAYAGVSAYVASSLVYAPQVAPTSTPAAYHLAYKSVTFTSRGKDKVALQGWFIPGVGANGTLSDARTIIVVHGLRANRTDPGMGLLDLSAALAKRGFAVLAFDMRGSGESQAEPLSLGYYEQNDVLGAVDFLRTGQLPYPKLGRPKAIGGWGESMGAATLLLAAAQEPAIRAVVADSAYSDALPLLEREIPKRSGLPPWFTPGVLRAAQIMYAINYSAIRPVDVIAKIAPRPILLVQGADDTSVPPSDMAALAEAASKGSGAQVETWLVPGATHAQAFHVAGKAYVDKVTAFFTTNLPTG
jgi:uncharacterized protein